MILRTLLLIVFLGGSPLMAEDRVLFKFENADAAKQWQSVNDGVMGEPINMFTGDHVLIPAHRRHRAGWTTPDEGSVWLAVFYTNSDKQE